MRSDSGPAGERAGINGFDSLASVPTSGTECRLPDLLRVRSVPTPPALRAGRWPMPKMWIRGLAGRSASALARLAAGLLPLLDAVPAVAQEPAPRGAAFQVNT